MSLVREELAALYANRAQAQMVQQAWPEGFVDARCSLECKEVGNVKACWRAGKCLLEMGRLEEASLIVSTGMKAEGRVTGSDTKELGALLKDIEAKK